MGCLQLRHTTGPVAAPVMSNTIRPVAMLFGGLLALLMEHRS